jgi:hypothetical protein
VRLLQLKTTSEPFAGLHEAAIRKRGHVTLLNSSAGVGPKTHAWPTRPSKNSPEFIYSSTQSPPRHAVYVGQLNTVHLPYCHPPGAANNRRTLDRPNRYQPSFKNDARVYSY